MPVRFYVLRVRKADFQTLMSLAPLKKFCIFLMRFSFIVLLLASLVLSHSFNSAPVDETLDRNLINTRTRESRFVGSKSPSFVIVIEDDHDITPRARESPNADSTATSSVIVIQDDHDKVSQVNAIQKYSDNTLMNESVYSKMPKCLWQNCDKTFNNESQLTHHINKDHLGRRMSGYKCQWKNCKQETKVRTNMMKHIRTHTGERPFVCPFEECGKAFVESETLNAHMDLFPCPLLRCDQKCNKVRGIRLHLFDHVDESLLSADSISYSDFVLICFSLRNNIPYPVTLSNRIALKERVIQNTQMSSVQESNFARIDNILKSEHNHVNTESTNSVTQSISSIELEIESQSKRPLQLDNKEFSTKRIKISQLTNDDMELSQRIKISQLVNEDP